MRRPIIGATGAILCALSLSACVDSSGPLLPDARPMFGEQLRLQFYSLRKGFADEPEQATYKWDGAKYARTGGGMSDIGSFSVHPFEGGNLIVQRKSWNTQSHAGSPTASTRWSRSTKTMPAKPCALDTVSLPATLIAASRPASICMPLRELRPSGEKARVALFFASPMAFRDPRASMVISGA